MIRSSRSRDGGYRGNPLYCLPAAVGRNGQQSSPERGAGASIEVHGRWAVWPLFSKLDVYGKEDAVGMGSGFYVREQKYICGKDYATAPTMQAEFFEVSEKGA